jgi:pimeloyl-ACP methyl ester carboxylesterase
MSNLLHLTRQGVEDSPLVFLHGVASSGRMFALRCPALAGRHNLLFPDLLGFGLSPRPAESNYDPAAHVEALQQTLLEKAPGQLAEGLTLVTHSLGGLVALAYAAQYPQHVKRLILFNPTLYWSPAEARHHLMRGSRMAHMILGYPRVAKAACLSLCSTGFLGHAGPYLLRKLPQDVAADAGKHSWTSLSRTMHNSIIHFDLTAHLNRLKEHGVPLTVITGQYDTLSYPEQSDRLQSAMPSVQVITLPFGHQPFYYKSDLCVEIVEAQLERVLHK